VIKTATSEPFLLDYRITAAAPTGPSATAGVGGGSDFQSDAPAEAESGCGCRAGAERPEGRAAALGLLALGAFVRRRRRPGTAAPGASPG
jgi:MYXO-CTERM domain-containing protein